MWLQSIHSSFTVYTKEHTRKYISPYTLKSREKCKKHSSKKDGGNCHHLASEIAWRHSFQKKIKMGGIKDKV
jgi:hypothetical protein